MTKNTEKPNWSYDGEYGPDRWHELYPIACSGERQSPVELGGATKKPLPPLCFHYGKWVYNVKRDDFTINLKPNISDAERRLLSGRVEPFLDHIHFHRPSEHYDLDGFYPMEMHMVHITKTGVVVVGVFITEGEANPEFEAIFRAIPAKTGEERQGITLDIANILPKEPDYYSYDGSLTTPPCTEGVKWIILKETISVSAGALSAYKVAFPPNARPVCQLNGRRVVVSA